MKGEKIMANYKITFENFEEIMEKLQAEFDPQDIEWRIGATNNEKTRGMALPYVTNRAIQNRLDQVFTPFGWKNEYKPWHGNAQICGISVKMVDYDNSIQWITKWDGADNTEFEPIKGGLSDSMKRSAVQWGIGRYLYTLPMVWVDIEQKGKGYYIKQYELDRLKTFLKTKSWTWGEQDNSGNNTSTTGSNAPQQGENPNESDQEKKATSKQMNCLLKNINQLGLTIDEIKGMSFEKADQLIKSLYNKDKKDKDKKNSNQKANKSNSREKGNNPNSEDKTKEPNDKKESSANKVENPKEEVKETSKEETTEGNEPKIEEKQEVKKEASKKQIKVEVISNGQKSLIASLIKQVAHNTKSNDTFVENKVCNEFSIAKVEALPKAQFSSAVSYLKSLLTA